jgi:hypothetical protein
MPDSEPSKADQAQVKDKEQEDLEVPANEAEQIAGGDTPPQRERQPQQRE